MGRGLRIGRDGRFDQSEAYDGCVLWGNTGSWVQLVKTGGGIFRSPFSLIRV